MNIPEDEKLIAYRLEIFISSHPTPAARDLATKTVAAFDAILASERLARNEIEAERDGLKVYATGMEARVDAERLARHEAEQKLHSAGVNLIVVRDSLAEWKARAWAAESRLAVLVRDLNESRERHADLEVRYALLETARQEPHEEKQG